jgi:hypothetical protein
MYICAEAASYWKDNGIIKVLQPLLITLESDLYDKMEIMGYASIKYWLLPGRALRHIRQ